MKAQPDYLSFLRILRGALKAKSYTYASIAAEIGISEMTMKGIVSGHPCKIEHLLSICDCLGISVLGVIDRQGG